MQRVNPKGDFEFVTGDRSVTGRDGGSLRVEASIEDRRLKRLQLHFSHVRIHNISSVLRDLKFIFKKRAGSAT